MTTPIETARRLRALQRRAGTPGEAEAAARALAKLLDKHRLEEAELDEQGPFVTDDRPLYAAGRVSYWRTSLIISLCRHYGVFVFMRREKFPRVRSRFMLHGLPGDIECVRYMFDWLSADATRLGMPLHRHARQSWRLGFVTGLDAQLRGARREASQDQPQSTALVLDGRFGRAESDFLKDGKTLHRRVQRMGSCDGNAFTEGFSHGLDHHFGKPLTEAS